ncbi:MAG: serine/threonine-protein kinase, partial [Myxococcota bacterium]
MTDSPYERLIRLERHEGRERWLAWMYNADRTRSRLVEIKQSEPDGYPTRTEATQLRHPNIASIFDIGENANGGRWAVTELVYGEPLPAIVHRLKTRHNTVLHPSVAVACVAQGAAGLHAAHGKNNRLGQPMIHGNLGPASLVVSYNGQLKLTDFDKSAAEQPTAANMSYMPPEQCMGEQLDASSDVFALGVILWELLTGHRLYAQGDYFELMEAICDAPVEPPSKHNASIPPFLDALVLKALSRERANRFSDCARLRSALERVNQRLKKDPDATTPQALVRELFSDRLPHWKTLARAEPKRDNATILEQIGILFKPQSVPKRPAQSNTTPYNEHTRPGDASPAAAAGHGNPLADLVDDLNDLLDEGLAPSAPAAKAPAKKPRSQLTALSRRLARAGRQPSIRANPTASSPDNHFRRFTIRKSALPTY